MWVSHEKFLEAVEVSWKESIDCSSGLLKLAGKLKRLKMKLVYGIKRYLAVLVQ